MGCKESQVQILPPRPIIINGRRVDKMSVFRLFYFLTASLKVQHLRYARSNQNFKHFKHSVFFKIAQALILSFLQSRQSATFTSASFLSCNNKNNNNIINRKFLYQQQLIIDICNLTPSRRLFYTDGSDEFNDP